MFRIRTYNQISDVGLSRLPLDSYQVGPDMEEPHALILRSHKLHDEVIPDSVLAVARAGAGVNNIPVDEYTHRGIVVFNTPGANANAVKELVTAALLLSSRGILAGAQRVQARLDGAEGSPVTFVARADPDPDSPYYELRGEGGGCDCRQGGDASGAVLALLGLALLLGRRRRRG